MPARRECLRRPARRPALPANPSSRIATRPAGSSGLSASTRSTSSTSRRWPGHQPTPSGTVRSQRLGRSWPFAGCVARPRLACLHVPRNDRAASATGKVWPYELAECFGCEVFCEPIACNTFVGSRATRSARRTAQGRSPPAPGRRAPRRSWRRVDVAPQPRRRRLGLLEIAVVNPQPLAGPVLERLGHVRAELVDYQPDPGDREMMDPLAGLGVSPSQALVSDLLTRGLAPGWGVGQLVGRQATLRDPRPAAHGQVCRRP
jgi:hypothetical protein